MQQPGVNASAIAPMAGSSKDQDPNRVKTDPLGGSSSSTASKPTGIFHVIIVYKLTFN